MKIGLNIDATDIFKIRIYCEQLCYTKFESWDKILGNLKLTQKTEKPE